jgi:hypothetical protein
MVTVTARAIFLIQRTSGLEGLSGRRNGVLATRGLVGNNPWGSVSQPQNDSNDNHPKKSDKEEPAQLAGFLRIHVCGRF